MTDIETSADKPTPQPDKDDILGTPPTPTRPDTIGFGPLMAQLFLIPLVIVIACVGVYLLFGWMATDHRTGMDLLIKIEEYAGADNKMTPWMTASKNEAALQLTLMLRNDDPRLVQGAMGHSRGAGGKNDRDAFERSLIAVFERIATKDPGTAGILAQAIGFIGSPEGAVSLRGAMKSENAQLRFEAARGLAVLRDDGSFVEFVALLRDDDPGCRKLAVWAIGFLADPTFESDGKVRGGRLTTPSQLVEARAAATKLLEDTERDVRSNAAIALACMDDTAGASVLLDLLEPDLATKLAAEADANVAHPLHRKPEQARRLGSQNTLSALKALGVLLRGNHLKDWALKGKFAAKVKALAHDGTVDPAVQQEAGRLLDRLG